MDGKDFILYFCLYIITNVFLLVIQGFMHIPVVSIVLPVYNSDAYLKESIESILAQTFTDFELIILNDGSSDHSADIILSYSDKRIIYLKNETNRGLIYTLNKGIEHAIGKYTARMDADDICEVNRLEIQKNWLDTHPQTSIVCSFSEFINEKKANVGFYKADRKYVSSHQLRKRLPYQNCITHPTIMGKSEIFKTYKYAAYQQNIEDYDLWLRLAADGKIIEKIPKSLLLYRLHPASITHTKLKKTNFFLKHFHCKRKYLASRVKNGKFNVFDLNVSFQAMADLLRALLKNAKKLIIKRNV